MGNQFREALIPRLTEVVGRGGVVRGCCCPGGVSRCPVLKINTSDNLILIQVYNNTLIKNNILRKRLAKLWDNLTSRNPLFKNIWPKYPMIVFKNGKNIKNMLISSKFTAPWQVKSWQT